MSQENVEIVRSAFSEYERGNFRIPGIFDPSVRVVWLDAVDGEKESEGLEELAHMTKEWLRSFEQITTVAERLIDAGDQVVVMAEWRGLGKASGAFTTWRYGAVYTLRDRKVTSIVSYRDPAEALEAAGLAEQDTHADS
jgi:ketosteroid isomerase-like protein